MTTASEGAPRRRRRKAAAKSEDEAKPATKKKASKRKPPPAEPPAGDDKPSAPKQPSGDDIFHTAAHQKGFPKAPDLQRGFQTIVTDIFAEGYDVVQEWKDIRKAMIVSDSLSPERLKRAANEAEDISVRAHRLYVVAKVEVQAYMRETESIYGAIRESAVQSLEAQKAAKTRTKQITDPDVKAEAARLHSDEWAEICTRRDWAEGMLSQLLRLSESAKSRCYTLSNMASPNSRSV